jgi:tetratricopeptide (TPR) repeat protein
MSRHSTSRSFLLIALLSLLLGAVPSILTAQEESAFLSDETMAERNLKLLVTKERAIWASLEAATNEEDASTAKPKFQEVLTGYDGLIRDNPEFVPAFVAYGLLLARIDEYKASRAIFMRANQLDPNIAVVKNQLGNFLVEEAKYKEALPYYLAAIELQPNEPLYHYQLGTLLTEFMDYFIKDRLYDRETIETQMQAAFQRAAELDPDSWAYGYRYAESFYDLENPDWDAAMVEWAQLEQRTRPGIERQTVQLHQANIMLKQGRLLAVRDILEQVTEPVLASNRRALEDELDGRLNP